MIFFLDILWFLRTTKVTLFYLYLWQLKGYHVGRFLDHFRTAKGRQAVVNLPNALKLILLIAGFLYWISVPNPHDNFTGLFIGILSVVYVGEGLIFFKNIFRRNLKTPALTPKTILLISGGILLELITIYVLYFTKKNIFEVSLWLVIIDLGNLFLVSALVLLTQPLVTIARNRIIRLAAKKRKGYGVFVIGITGSYGKTSTKEFLAAILSSKYKILKTKEHENTSMGIARRILSSLTVDHEVFIVEMGAYDLGGVKILSDMADPRIGLVTGINEQHLAIFKSQEALISAEGGRELALSLPSNGIMIYNGNNNTCRQEYDRCKKLKVICSSVNPQDDFYLDQLMVDKDKFSCRISQKGGESAFFSVKIRGAHQAENLLIGVAAARNYGMDLREIAQACGRISYEHGSIKVITSKNHYTLIDASYSANPAGVKAEIDYLNLWTGKKIIVMPCLIELGPAASKIHFEIGQAIGKNCELAIITAREYFTEIKKGAIASGMDGNKIIFNDHPVRIAEQIKSFLGDSNNENDAVLIEGRVPSGVMEKLLS